MSQAPTATGRPRETTTENLRPVEGDRAEEILNALEDADCRAILDATCESALTAKEVSTACDVPLSTAYRKLDALVDAGLLVERVRLSRSGKHASEYARAVEDVVVSVSPEGGVELHVTAADAAGAER